MVERIRTGVRGLDEVLGSGIPANAINLIVGLPGTGKTLLAQQLAFANATEERPAVYLSTVSEPFDKLIRYGQGLEFFDPDAVGRRVFFDDAGTTLLEGGLAAVLDQIERLLNTHEPSVLVIDSFKPLSTFSDSDLDYRRFLHTLAARLSLRPVMTLWLGEYSAGELASSPEFAISDAVLWLGSTRHEDRETRLLQVLKLRGSAYLSGRHGYRLSADGLRVFPRLADAGSEQEYAFSRGSVSTGVATLDSILGGGYRPGASTLVVGPAGIGKTVMGLQFVCLGAKPRENSVFATLEENPSQIARAAHSFGWSLEKSRVRLMYRSAVDLNLDEWVYGLLQLMESSRARRAVIDGLANLRTATPDPLRFREYLYSLIQRCSRQGVSLMLSLECAEMFGVTRLGEVALSQLADNVLLLQFIRRDGEYGRAMTVIKSRAMATETRMSEFTIRPTGLALVTRDRQRQHG